MIAKPDRARTTRSGSPVEKYPHMEEYAKVPRCSPSDGQHLTDRCLPFSNVIPSEYDVQDKMPQDTKIGLSREVEDDLAFVANSGVKGSAWHGKANSGGVSSGATPA